jgi:predicted ATPase
LERKQEMAENYWLVRPGARGEIASQVYERGVVAIGWSPVGDISRLTSLDDVKERYRQVYPDSSPHQVGFGASQLFTFLSRIAVGDIVVVPVPLERKVWLGRVQRPYQFDEQVISRDYPHVRGVEWLQDVPYEDISPRLRASTETPRAVFSLQKRAAEVRRLLERPDEPLESQVYRLPRQRLTKVHFERFKAFEERVDVDMAPVTLVAGVNSSGKTTILQALILARQTLIAPYRAAVEDALRYDDDLVKAAYFHELIFGKSPKGRNLRLGFTVQVRTDSYAVYEYFGDLPEDAGTLNMRVDLDAQFDYDRGRGIVIVSQIVLTSRIRHAQIDYRGPTLTIEPYGAQWRLSLVVVGERSRRIFEDMLNVDRFIPVWEIRGRPRTQVPERRYIYDAFKSLFAPAMELLRNELEERLFYVGPLRSAPQRPYLRQSVIGLDVGTSGEVAVQLLHEHWGREVDFVELPDDLTHFGPAQAEPKRMELSRAVQEALRLLGMEQQLRIKKQGESYEAELSLLSRHDRFVSIVEVGFGVSQILPIIAVSLLSPVNSILIFEQPEIHLHPRAQAGLGELFLCLARTGRRVLLETHGDHLINRLRRRVAEDKSGELENWVNILFVHTPESKGQGAIVQTGRIDRYGQIENWPPGFLAESAQDARAIMLAASTKRLKEKTQGQVQ